MYIIQHFLDDLRGSVCKYDRLKNIFYFISHVNIYIDILYWYIYYYFSLV